METPIDLQEFLSSDRIIPSYPTVSQRYYEHKFFRNPLKPNCDQTVLLHSNRVCLITLSPNHDIIRHKKSVKNIDFNVDEELNRLDNKVVGKWKKGGQKVCPESILCRITCDDNQVFDVKACINGTIVEINTKLIDNYDLLTQKTWSDGYIAIILPYRWKHESEKESLMSSNEYRVLLENDKKLEKKVKKIGVKSTKKLVNPHLNPIGSLQMYCDIKRKSRPQYELHTTAEGFMYTVSIVARNGFKSTWTS